MLFRPADVWSTYFGPWPKLLLKPDARCRKLKRIGGKRKVIHMLIYSPPRIVALAKKLETIWDVDPHTQAKHAILRRYWEAWLPIMSTFNERVLYIDGFAGPGKYRTGEDGSPLIALTAARDHRAKPTAEIVFIFIEKEQDRFEHLKSVVAEIKPTLPPNFHVNCVHGTFDDQMTSVLDDLDSQRKRIAPSLVFIDPFGFSHTPFNI